MKQLARNHSLNQYFHMNFHGFLRRPLYLVKRDNLRNFITWSVRGLHRFLLTSDGYQIFSIGAVTVMIFYTTLN